MYIAVWSELKKSEGGRGTELITILKENGIKARAGYCPYVGHIGIEVEKSQAVSAMKIISPNY